MKLGLRDRFGIEKLFAWVGFSGAGSQPMLRSEAELRTSRRWKLAILFVAAAALAFKIVLALRTYGTNDVYRYELFLVWSRPLGVQLYKAAWDFNHPPSMIYALRAIGWLAQVTGLPFQFCLRLPGILADAGSLWLVWKLAGDRIAQRSTALALLFLAAAPVSIMVSGFHGNTDGVLIFFVLLSVWLSEKGIPAWAAGAVFGLSLCIKVSPVVAAPVMILYQTGIRRRLEFLAGVLAVPLIAWQPFLWQDPQQVYNSVFGYRSIAGIWGLSYLTSRLSAWLPSLAGMNASLIEQGPIVLLGACAAAAIYMNAHRRRPRLYAQAGFIFFLFLSVASGFGLQYLAWLAPWVVELGALPAAIYFVASGLFLFSVYNFWSQGMPWYLADSNRIGPWGGYIELLQLFTWVSVVLLTWLAWKRIRAFLTHGATQDEKPLSPWILLAGMAFALTFYAGTQWVETQRSGALARAMMGPSSVASIQAQGNLALAVRLQQMRGGQDSASALPEAYNQSSQAADLGAAQQFLDRSVADYQGGRFEDSVADAGQALRLRPDLAEAYNNMAAALCALNRWDEAIQAAQEAIRLKPDFQLARNNLAWAEAEKRRKR